jgi:hypothetical protein
MDFEVKGATAVYSGGKIEAAEIALAIFSAHEVAKSESITQFIVAIPNAQFTAISEIARIVGCRGLVEQNGSEGVTLTYKFHRTVIVTMTGAPALLQTTPEPIDLAHRVVTAPTTNGIESI